jgi:putative sterol carrier protein
MTWQGGKKAPEPGSLSAFGRLKPFAGSQDDAAKTLQKLAAALSDYASSVRLQFRLIAAKDGEPVEHWEVRGGAKNAKAHQKKTKNADVIIVLRPETWMQIAQGRLAPYEALYTGKLRVGGDFEMAKAITKHLTDPAARYVAPC